MDSFAGHHKGKQLSNVAEKKRESESCRQSLNRAQGALSFSLSLAAASQGQKEKELAPLKSFPFFARSLEGKKKKRKK